MGAETARFQAFATRREDDLPPAWRMKAPGSKIGILVVIVIVVALLAILLGVTLGA